MILSNKKKAEKLCNTKSGRHTHVRAAEAVWGHANHPLCTFKSTIPMTIQHTLQLQYFSQCFKS